MSWKQDGRLVRGGLPSKGVVSHEKRGLRRKAQRLLGGIGLRSGEKMTSTLSFRGENTKTDVSTTLRKEWRPNGRGKLGAALCNTGRGKWRPSGFTLLLGRRPLESYEDLSFGTDTSWFSREKKRKTSLSRNSSKNGPGKS